MQVLNLKRALRDPVGTAGHAVGSAVRSTSFLAAFVGIYSSVISLQRKLFSWDHKLLYYVAGDKLQRQHALLELCMCVIVLMHALMCVDTSCCSYGRQSTLFA